MGEDKHEEEALEEALEEEPRHTEFCVNHKQKILRDIMHVGIRRRFLAVSGNLFTAYMKGSGFDTLNSSIEHMDEEQGHSCPMCYWEELEASSYYLLETVLGIRTDRNIVDGHEGRIITDI